ncbi:MAG: hypothetical protein U0905_12795 [Pirellulales bacterium]
MMEPKEFIDGYLDDMLTEEQHALLCNWIKADPKNARQFAEAVKLHDQLRNAVCMELSEQHSVRREGAKATSSWGSRSIFSTSLWSTAASIAVLMVGIGILWFGSGPSTASAAFRELDRIIISNVHSTDRTYQLVVEDIVTPTRRGNRPEDSEQRPTKPPLDGAVLHVREGQQFVLIRKTSEGLPFITGSNGKQSWAVNTRGPVRVSSDIRHFDRDLPGHETSVPLTNLQEGLERLKKSYDLQFSTVGPEEYEMQDRENVRLLMAVKKPKERGPQRVEIAYDSKSGHILHMRFIQMPYGPERLDLRMLLVDENALPLDFFEHTSHHASDRKVEMEN